MNERDQTKGIPRHTTRHHRASTWLVLLTTIALVTAACGDDDDADAEGGGTTSTAAETDTTTTAGVDDDGATDDGATESTTAAPPPDAAGGESDPEGVVRVGYDMVQGGSGALNLDPVQGVASTNDSILYLLHGRILRPTPDGTLVPEQAESTSVVDANTIEIVVRAGLTFHDGSPFDAEAVKTGLDRSLTNGTPETFNEGFFSLQSVEVTAPDTVRLSIPDGTAASWHDIYLGSWQTTILPADFDPDDPVGAGPMTFVSFQPEQSLELAKYPDYWDADSILVGGIEFIHVSSEQPQSGISALQSDQIDFVLTDVSQLPALSGNLDRFVKPDPNATIALMFCKADGPLADPNVRVAINQAIDRDSISEAIYEGTALPATQLWPDGHRFNNPDIADLLAYDPDSARALLEEAGYADGFTLDMYIVPALGIPDVAAVLDQELAEVGIDLNVITPANFVEEFLTPRAAGAGLIPGNNQGRQKLTQWIGDARGNACGYNDPDLNALGDELAQVSDSSDEAVDLWHQIGEKIVSEGLGGFILFRSSLAAYNTERLGGLDVWPIGNVLVPDVHSTFVLADS